MEPIETSVSAAIPEVIAAAPLGPMPEPRRRLRLLVLASRVPDRRGRADQRTVFRWLEFMAARGHRIHLIALDTWESPGRESAALSALCERLEIFHQPLAGALWHGAFSYLRGRPLQVGAFWNPHAAAAARRALEGSAFDLIYAHLIRTAEYVRGAPQAPKVLAMQVAQSLNLARMVRYGTGRWRRLLYALELRAVRGYERGVSRDFERCAVISAHDRDAIGLPLERTWLVPHGVDLQEFSPAPHPPPDTGAIVLSGVLNTATNVEAASWLLTAIWPRIRSCVPGARLRVVGREPAAVVRRLARSPGVELVASPSAIAPYLRDAVLAVAPVRIAAGLQNKVLEAMASGVAVVATPQANEGIGASPGLEIVLAADAESFAREVVLLLRDPARRAELGRRARARMERDFSWERHWWRFEQRLERLAETAHERREIAAGMTP